jgi:hypothetical protein
VCDESPQREPGPTFIIKKKRHTPEQIIMKLRTPDEEQARGTSIEEVSRRMKISVGNLLSLEQEIQRSEEQDIQAAQGVAEGDCPAQKACRRAGIGHEHAQGDQPGKVMSPARRHTVVAHLDQVLGGGKLWACSQPSDRTTQELPAIRTKAANGQPRPDYRHPPSCTQRTAGSLSWDDPTVAPGPLSLN